MSSAALYKAFIEVGASEERATTAAEDVVQVSQLSELATKSDMAQLIMTVQAGFAKAQSEIDARFAKQQEEMRVGFAKMENRMIKWMVYCGFLYTGLLITAHSFLT